LKVPFVDLRSQYDSIKSEIDNSIQSVINETAFISGKYAAEFEKNYARKYAVKNCISVANGTDAIYLILRALNIGPNDEVITVANTWISTAETISQAGAKPVFVDIEQDFFPIDISKLEQKITSRTKAIIPVHLYGHPAEVDKIKNICETYKLHLIEDCAQAHFAEYKGQKVGTFGIASTFSFYPGKNLGAYGDAGAVITNDDTLAAKIRMIANHGSLKKHHHMIEGVNSRMDGIQAAVLSVKLPHISDWNQKRYDNARYYNKLLKGVVNVAIPMIRSNATHVFHLYVIRTEKRKGLQAFLSDCGIATGIHYPTALPFLEAYRHLGHSPEDFPVSYKYQDTILSLPMYPELTYEQIEYVAEKIREFFGG
jgi:dTDP-4-amino-4,6-dideoxygalactose transaminase